MKLFAASLLICLFLVLPQRAFAQDLPKPALPADELRCDEPITRACSAALAELLAARKLIEAQTKEIEAAQLRLASEKERTKLLAEKTQQQAEQIETLNTALTAEREAKEFLRLSNESKDKTIADLKGDKRRLKRQRVVAAVVGVAVGAVIRR